MEGFAAGESNIRSMPVRIFPWAEIQRFYDAGNGFARCRERFGFSGSAWAKAVRRGEITVRARRRYDWAEIQRYYDEGHSYAECRARFGFAPAAWTKAVLRGEVQRPSQALDARKGPSPIEKQDDGEALLARGWYTTELLRRVRDIRMEGSTPVHPTRPSERQPVRPSRGNVRMLRPNCHRKAGTFGTKN